MQHRNGPNAAKASVREFTEQLRTFFAANGIATEACFDRWIFEATGPKPPRPCRAVTSIRQALKRARAQQRKAAR
jgi:hypothetical protein